MEKTKYHTLVPPLLLPPSLLFLLPPLLLLLLLSPCPSTPVCLAAALMRFHENSETEQVGVVAPGGRNNQTESEGVLEWGGGAVHVIRVSAAATLPGKSGICARTCTDACTEADQSWVASRRHSVLMMWHVWPPLSEMWWEEEEKQIVFSVTQSDMRATPALSPPPISFPRFSRSSHQRACTPPPPTSAPPNTPGTLCILAAAPKDRSSGAEPPESLAAIYSRPGHHDRVVRCGAIHLPAAARSSTATSAG